VFAESDSIIVIFRAINLLKRLNLFLPKSYASATETRKNWRRDEFQTKPQVFFEMATAEMSALAEVVIVPRKTVRLSGLLVI
jgi:hypothetical protein